VEPVPDVDAAVVGDHPVRVVGHARGRADRQQVELLVTEHQVGHAEVVLELVGGGFALLAAGLWAAHRGGAWPASTRTPLRIAAIAISAYVVETVFHLAAVVDSDALAAGDAAPVAFTHLGLAAVLYPVSGLAVAWLGVHIFQAVGVPEKVFGVIGVVGGLLHAVSVPLTLLAPDLETTPLFASSGMLFAAWAIGLGVSGLRTAEQPTYAAARTA